MNPDDTPFTDASNSFSEETRSLGSSAGASGSAMVPGAHLGHYEIIEVIGAGGMGVVYRARQESPARDVALKVIRGRSLSPDALRRFEFECNVLGRLQHVGIAQIYDAGFNDGDPYFAMELIDGESLTEYVNRRELSTRERLALLVKICDAVQHAHAKGVVHRDLKPGNILVTREGQPKILDFGVARATDSDIQTATIQTEIGQLVGTVPYMSPEQASGDSNEIDTRSDVYALGVVAYELLAGRLPYDIQRKMIHEAVRVIREDDPAPLSSIHRTLRGDVEVIIGKALAKEKDRRYQSAHDFGTDVQRFLRDEPIEARPPSAPYQLKKFARRHTAVVGGAAAVLVALVLGLAGTLWQANRAAERARVAEAAETAALQAEAEAQREAATALTVSDFLSSMLEGVGPRVAAGRDTTLLREIADQARARVDTELADEPVVRSRMQRVLGIVYHDLAEYDQAETLLEQSIESAREARDDRRAAVARAMYDLGRLYETRGQFDDATRAFHEARQGYIDAGLGMTPNAWHALSGVAGVHVRQRQYGEAIPILREVLAGFDELGDEIKPDSVASAKSRLSVALNAVDRNSEEAVRLAEEALAIRRNLYGQSHPDIAESLTNLSVFLFYRGEQERAFERGSEAIEQHRLVYGSEHPNTASALSATATLHDRDGHPELAIPLRAEALDIWRQAFGDDNRNTLDGVFNLGWSYALADDPANAEPYFRELLEYARSNYAPGDNRTSGVILLVTDSIMGQGRPEDAEPLLREAFDGLSANRPVGHPQITSARGKLLDCLIALSKFDDAESILLASFDVSKGDPNAAQRAAEHLAILYERWNDTTPGEGHGASAIEWRKRAASSAPGAE